MIEDSELRDLFRIESDEHLQAIENGLLRIEKEPGNQALLEELFREAHSLKGASRMLELLHIERIFHRFEDILGAARSHQKALSTMVIDAMYKSLDAIRKLVTEAVTGKRAEVDVNAILDSLQVTDTDLGAEAASLSPSTNKTEVLSTATAQDDTGQAAITSDAVFENTQTRLPAQANAKANASTSTSTSASNDHFVIDTIRVETRKLDTLMTHVGELTVARVRIAQRHLDLDALQEKWDQIHLKIKNSGNEDTEFLALLDSHASHLESLIGAAYDDSARLDFVTAELEEGIRSIRLLPFSTIFNLFGPMVRKISREHSKEVALHIEGGDIMADKRILEEMKDPLMHILRNAIDHGLESASERLEQGKPASGSICLLASQTSSTILIEIRDDGRGLDLQGIKQTAIKSTLWRQEDLDVMSEEQLMGLIFVPGFSTRKAVSDVSGRGVGMDVVQANVKKLKGSVSVSSLPGHSCSIHIRLPLTLATSRVLIIVDQAIKYAVPVEYVKKSSLLFKQDLFSVDGHLATLFENKTVAVAYLHDLLQFSRPDFVPRRSESLPQKSNPSWPCIFMEIDGERFGLIIDELLDEQEIVLKSQSALLQRVRHLSGITILGTGEICMVLNPSDLIGQLKHQRSRLVDIIPVRDEGETKKQCILLAEDSLTTRAQMKRILESGGYEVVTAVDGMDAYLRLQSTPVDAIVSDINMPNMDGLTLTQQVRANKKYSKLPIVLVTMLATEGDKQRGLEVGASAYISKAAFEQKLLLDTLKRLM